MFKRLNEQIMIVRIKDKPLNESEVSTISQDLIFNRKFTESPLENKFEDESLNESAIIAAIACLAIPLIVTGATLADIHLFKAGEVNSIISRTKTDDKGQLKYVSGGKVMRTIKKYLSKSEYSDAVSDFKKLYTVVRFKPNYNTYVPLDENTKPLVRHINELYEKALKEEEKLSKEKK